MQHPRTSNLLDLPLDMCLREDIEGVFMGGEERQALIININIELRKQQKSKHREIIQYFFT